MVESIWNIYCKPKNEKKNLKTLKTGILMNIRKHPLKQVKITKEWKAYFETKELKI